MVRLSAIAFHAALAYTVAAYPRNKRISETILDSMVKWKPACFAAQGGNRCNDLSVSSFQTLLAAAKPCDQQDAADSMVDLAKSLNSSDMIRFTQIFVQQPRNTPESLSVPYCQSPPRNPELIGLYQCQFQGTDPTTFVGNIGVGGNGTIPFGMSSPLDPPGSCPAYPSGPIPAGAQLVDLVDSPFASESQPESTLAQ
ncbi:hypothetical protein BDY19DRAFT_895923 [Irpex rosettiformis]|uniref:Uncharacterized protein n=1 Tax=Irpex rosettiformis TaxID=378272 RepID=A0ACB8TUN8_9APHY|nr:hypothetical protein BDY19DRAFT_895923 [Irpex rosettiformis]